MKSLLRTRAFSLIEITLALGIISFSLVAILGYFNVGLNVSRDSMVETTLPKIAEESIAQCSGTNAIANGETRLFLYNWDGTPVQSGSSYYFQCSISASNGEMAGISEVHDRLKVLTLKVASRTGTTVLHTTAY